MTRALATLLFLFVAAPAHASFSLEQPETRLGGLHEFSEQELCWVWVEHRVTRQLLGVLEYDCASGQPVNLYAYAAFDPINFSDPWGLESRGFAERALREHERIAAELGEAGDVAADELAGAEGGELVAQTRGVPRNNNRNLTTGGGGGFREPRARTSVVVGEGTVFNVPVLNRPGFLGGRFA